MIRNSTQDDIFTYMYVFHGFILKRNKILRHATKIIIVILECSFLVFQTKIDFPDKVGNDIQNIETNIQ